MLPLSLKSKETNGNEPWHALRTRYRHERVVDELLTSQGFETFLPIYTVVHRWKDRTKKLSVPLFPNYVFLRGGTILIRKLCNSLILKMEFSLSRTPKYLLKLQLVSI